MLSAAFTCALAPVLASADLPTAADSTVMVHVGSLRNTKGVLGCRLFRSAQGFPETSEGTVEVRVPISGAVTQCEFPNVAPGTYAVSVMHDENGNQKLDKNLFGVPTEGYGVSNNHTYAMSSPKWGESTFVVEQGKNQVLQIQLRY
jgi:uncharacterized protein (DUF2141 family)